MPEFGVGLGRPFVVNRGGTAGNDYALYISILEFGDRDIMGKDLAVDVAFAHPPGDQHRILSAEVEDND
jgi:hypothetical protein